jgi:hypothetical protein
MQHAAAVLFAWHLHPETFTQMDSIDTILERQSKAQLLTLVKQLLQKQPEMEWQLTMPPLPGHKRVPVDPNDYRRQVDLAFQQAGHGWDAVYGISSDLSQMTATAAHFAQQQDYANAATIYEVVARETLSSYLSYHDEDGALGRVVQECVEGLGACLENVRDDEILRQQILTAIFTVYRFDVDHGSMTMLGLRQVLSKPQNAQKRQFLVLRSISTNNTLSSSLLDVDTTTIKPHVTIW